MKLEAIALDPLCVMRLVEQLTEAEALELATYAEASVNQSDFVTRTSEWLIARFGQQRPHQVH